MEECQTPTLAQMMEFKYELTPTMVFDPSRLQEAQSLIVNRINVRCFTPTMKNFQSPGLSPINECTETLLGSVAVGVAANMENFQKSLVAGREEYFKVPFVKTKNMQQKQMHAMPQQLTQQQQQSQQSQQQQQPQQALPKFSSHFVSDSPPIFTLNSTTNSENDFSVDSTSPDSSAILGIVSKNNNNSNSSNNNNTDCNNNNSNNSMNDSDSPSSSSSLLKTAKNATFTNSRNNNSTGNDNNNNNNSTINNNNNNNNNNISNSNASRNLSNTNLLDRTMNISTLLRSVGLDQYIDLFEEQNMDLEQFMNIRSEDFPLMGVRKAEDQKVLSDLLCELNGA